MLEFFDPYSHNGGIQPCLADGPRLTPLGNTFQHSQNRRMSLNEALAIVGGIATAAGLWLAVYYGRREGRRRKSLAYEAGRPPWPLASSASLSEYHLSLSYTGEQGEPRQIEDAYAQALRFANFGHESIRRDDIAPANAIRIEVEDAEVLDAIIEAVTRDVTAIELGPPTTDGNVTSIPITFDYLDFHDGALVRLLTTARPTRLALVGDIIGMPEGVRTVREVSGRRAFWGPLGVALVVLFIASAFAAIALAGRVITDTWWSLALIPLPLVAIVVPVLIAILISETLWPKSTPSFPRALARAGLPFFAVGPERMMSYDDFVFFEERNRMREAAVSGETSTTNPSLRSADPDPPPQI